MMKIYWRLMGFAKPIEKFAIPYSIFTLLHAVFNVFNFVMIVPILNILFDKEAFSNLVITKPQFEFSTGYLEDLIRYGVFSVYGEEFNLMQVLLLLGVILICFSLLSNLFRYLGGRTMENMRIHTLLRLRNAVFDNVMGLEVGYFTNEKKGDVIAKLTSDVGVVQFTVTNTLQVAFREPFMILFYLAAMLAMSWQLTIFSVIYLPIVAFVIGSIVKRLRHQAKRNQKLYAEMVSTIDESLSGIKVLNAYNAVDYIKDKFRYFNRTFSKISKSMAKRSQLASPMSEFLGIVAMSGLLLFGGNLVLSESMGASEFIAYLAIFSQITRPVRSFVDAFSGINQGIAAGERVLGLLDTKPTIVDKPDAVEVDGFKKEVKFDDVYFRYEKKPVICGIDLSIKKGQTVALVGPSGGGKSTLSDLIPRFYDIEKGSISIDGLDIRDVTIESLREQIGVVSQDTVLFNDTIEGNIRMGRRDATMEEIIAAAKVANAHDFIMETENGYQTNIGDMGKKLSGGQRQRLSIARAVLKNPAILILDEATSALDTESEKLVQEALDNLLVGRTSVVIAHRLSTIYNADKICVIEQGRVTEEGTHAELIKKGGTYKKLVDMQNLG